MVQNKRKKEKHVKQLYMVKQGKPLALNLWKINQVTSKCQHIFLIKLVKKGLKQKK